MDHDSIVHLPPGYPEGDLRYAVLYPRDGRNLFDPATVYGGQAWRADETARMLIRDGEVDPLILVGIYEDDRRYAVLYPRDGRNLFDPATAYEGQAWRADETAGMLIRNGEVELLILVGIYNAGHARIDEYTASRDRPVGKGGQAHLHGCMLMEELNPFIDYEYRILPDARHTGIGDSWLGGLVPLTIGLRYPDIFGKLAVMSPSVWRDHRAIPRTVAANPLHSSPRMWLDIGTAEGQSTTEDARLLRDMLSGKSWRDGLDLAYYEAGGAGHNERGWGVPLGLMLQFLVPNNGV